MTKRSRDVARQACRAIAWVVVTGSTALAGDPPPLATELVVAGLDEPVFVTAVPGDTQRLFVLEQLTARIVLVKNGVIEPEPFLDLAPLVVAGGEQGLLGMAFHPEYTVNGLFFVFYNDLNENATLARYAVDPGDPDKALPASGTVLLSVPKPFAQHNGGMLAFGKNGLLWLGIGDGGGSNDPFDNAQDLGSLLGKMLRIDVNGPAPYGIPASNPFVGVAGAQEEIYAYGLRNPWRFSIDPSNGLVWIGDVGQAGREEIDLLRTAGSNFGWRCEEGTLCNPLWSCCPVPLSEPPIHEYDHNEGCAVIGGYVYRGSDIPGLQGHYLFGDHCTSQVWSLDVNSPGGAVIDRTAELSPPGGTLGFISSFGLDGRGELLIVGHVGEIYRVVEADEDPDCDGDGRSAAAETLAGTEFDLNGNGVPDSCELLLDGTPIVLGAAAQLDFIGAQPQQIVGWFGSLRGIGPGPCLFNGTLCLDLLPFYVPIPGGDPDVFFMGLGVADAMGHASKSFVVPTEILFPTPEVAFQAIAVDGVDSVKSNPILRTIDSP